MTETWLPILNGDYAVSSLGRVRRERPGRKTWPGKILRQSVGPTGYIQHTLCQNGKTRTYYAHRLAAVAFLGPMPEGKEVNHIDGVKSNNSHTNLEYVTRKENVAHAHATGLIPKRPSRAKPRVLKGGLQRGDKHWTHRRPEDVKRGDQRPEVCKVTGAQVIEMRALWKSGVAQVVIAERYCLSKGQVCRIINGTRWGHL